MPKGYVQNMLAEQEKIIVITRQHWFVVASAIFLESVVILITLTLTILGIWKLPKELFKIIAAGVGFFILFIFAISMLRDLLIWWNRQYLITTLRVIQIAGVINKNLTDSSLEKVNDVKLSQSILGRIFGYGDVEILTASELGVNLFRRIGNPVGFKTAMLNAKQELDRGMTGGRAMHQDDVPALIAQLDKLRQQGVISEEEFQRKKQELLAKM
jgi:uncharacterized membrane protein YdbT with pleckstrin-like domain